MIARFFAGAALGAGADWLVKGFGESVAATKVGRQ
jgi:hypothetical protein